MHTRANEDEYSFILRGRVGVQLGDDVLDAGPGDLALKPRGVPHTFWNAGDDDARLLEIISPAGFEVLNRTGSDGDPIDRVQAAAAT